MRVSHFYEVLNIDLERIIEKYRDSLQLFSGKAPDNQKKSYALLIWFLDFYGKIYSFQDFITDGDGDSSCDILFSKVNQQGKSIYYIVQSKWNNAANAEKLTEKDEVLKALSDFESILNGTKKKVNDKLQSKLKELEEHLRENGEVKFLFLTLSKYEGQADENIESFLRNDVNISFDVIDINKIRLDYIDYHYKGIKPINPLEKRANPEVQNLTLEIFQNDGKFLTVDRPYRGYVFLVRPKTLYDLFHEYEFSIFFKNVRNPLPQSNFNEQIERTALDNPMNFWYYNNGVTAITNILPEVGKRANKIQLSGLQIINGAQTVYSVYSAYKNAPAEKRKQLDNQMFITLRLLESGGKDFDLNVTRFTNSQNPVLDRDFCANDDVQIRLQEASYKTNIWYEKRREEFRSKPDGVTIVSNEILGNLYLAYYLQDPISVIDNYIRKEERSKDLLFISAKVDSKGLYEKVFNHDTNFDSMLVAYYLYELVMKNPELNSEGLFYSNFFHKLALFRLLMQRYFDLLYSATVQLDTELLKRYKNGTLEELGIKAFVFLENFLQSYTTVYFDGDYSEERYITLLSSQKEYQKILQKMKEMKLEISDIDNVKIDK